ncbi:MAG: hypothetical protein V5A64_06310 [Candidatus Thermoplasmatota archaeon]
MTSNKNNNFCLKKCFSWSFVLRILMVISLILAFWKKDYTWVVGTFIGIFISILPTILKRDVEITLPWIFDFLIAAVVSLHMCGRLLDYYYIIPGYELLTRFFISLLVAFIGLAFIYILDEYWEGLKMDKYAMGFVVVIATMSVGVILEFIKWLNISGYYYYMTNDLLMKNLGADTIAGIIVAIIGVRLIKSGEFDEMTDKMGKQIDEALIHRKKEEKGE